MKSVEFNIIKLKKDEDNIAKAIVDLQLASYQVEAKIIGSNIIPTLYDTVESIKESDEVFLGCIEKEELVGLISYKHEYGILDIHRLAVLPNHFKRGVACNLLKEVVETNPEAHKVIVATGSKNTPAINLYKKLGFSIIRTFIVEDTLSITQLELVGDLKINCSRQRGENEMFKTILDFAKSRPDIKAVLLNGSRVNEKVKADRFQDYDLVCGVDKPETYFLNQDWIKDLGTVLIKQVNSFDFVGSNCHIYLIQFDDGNRTDIQFVPADKIHLRDKDSLERIIYNPYGLVKELPEASDVLYHTQKPSASDTLSCINNILWCSGNVVKGICRGEYNYAKRMQEQIIRADLNKLMRWNIASENDWAINTGVFGKWMESNLAPPEWEAYVKTCKGYTYDDMWQSMILMIDLVRYYGEKLTSNLGLEYPYKDEEGIRKYISMCENYR